MQYYTNIFIHKGKIYIRGIDHGKQVSGIYNYKPYLFVPSKKSDSKYRTVDDQVVDKVDFDSIWDAKQFIKEYDDVGGFPIYGLNKFQYTYLYDNFPGTIDYDPSKISIVALDIENKVGNEDIATSLITTPNEITAITLSKNGHKYSLGCKDYAVNRDDLTYIKCKDEKDLLQRFIQLWKKLNPDIITGWNVEFYDIPYLVGRIGRILGEERVVDLSPWGLINEYDVEVKGKKVKSFEFKGITTLDYMNIYKKFVLKPREKYSLDYISEVELDERKVDYNSLGYSNLNDLYDRNFQLFLDYNIQDVELIDKLEYKLRLIELVFELAYDAKINFIDTQGSVLQWDIIFHNYLLDNNVVVSPQKRSSHSDFVGGYVKDVMVGRHKWVVSFDLDGLYPHLYMTYNIGPDTFVDRLSSFPTIDEIVDGAEVPHGGYSVAANGCRYRKDRQSFVGKLLEKKYSERKYFKKLMLEAEQKFEETGNPDFKIDISRYHNKQHARKINSNSFYGAMGNVWFRWFDINGAEGITMSGQLAVKWIGSKFNKYLNKVLGTTDEDFVIAQDTDSAYLCLDKIVQKQFPNETDTMKIVKWLDKFCDKILNPFVEECYVELVEKMNAYQQKMKMKRENIADVGIWIAKKNYILNVWNSEGVQYDKPKLKMVGIQAIRSSTPKSCREALVESIKLVVNTDEATVQKYIADYKERFRTLSFEEIASPRGVSNIDQYTSKGPEMFIKGTPINAKGSILYNRLLKQFKLTGQYEEIGNGDKIKYCYLKTPNPYGINVIAAINNLPEQFDLNKYLDYDLQFEKAFIQPLSGIMKAVGWDIEKRSTLEGFFS